MIPWNTLSDSVSVAAGLAAFLAAIMYLLVTRARSSSLAWLNRLFALATLSVGVECLVNVFASSASTAQAPLIGRVLLAVSMLACAALSVPIYLRVRRHPQYDEIYAANKQLEYTKRLFRAFLDGTPFSAYVVGADERLVYTNEKAREDFGASEKDVVGEVPQKWLPTEIAEKVLEQCRKVQESGAHSELVLKFSHHGKAHTYLSSFFPLPGPRGEALVGIVSIEISEELQAKEMDSLLASLVELSPNAIYTVCNQGTVMSWNKGAEEMLGYRADEIIGQSATRLAPPKHHARVHELIEQLESGNVINDRPFIHLSKDGARRLITLSATKIKSYLGAGASYAAIGRDETQDRRAASQRKALNRELSLRVEDLSRATNELLEARDQALDAASLKSAFVANMSHALRTPISGILGLSELILRKKLNSETQDMVQTIQTSAEALLAIVNDILDLSQLEDGRLPVERRYFRPRNLVQDCLKLVMPAALEKGLYINLSVAPAVPPQAIGDAFKIRQILLNLLGNAVKFTGAGNIQINLSVLADSDDEAILKFAVTDTGTGIAAQDRHLLFSPFSRIEKSSRGFKGTGLGLAISKRFAELMEGSLQYEDASDGGSTFTFTVPVEKAQSEQTTLGLRLAEGGILKYDDSLQRCKVLAVEDNKILSALIMRQLANIGVTAESAATGEAALNKIRATTFDIILLDINLPDIDGYEITRRVRQMESASRHGQVIIAMTAGAMSGDRERALQAGMDDYLAKPVHINQLHATLSKWTSSFKKEETLARELPQTAVYEGLC